MRNSIKTHRERLGMSHEYIANKLSISPQLVMFWESGLDMPNKKHALKLREEFGITLDELLLNEMQVINFSTIKENYKILIYEVYYSFIGVEVNRKNLNSTNIHKIRFLRDRVNMNQDVLASHVGLSRSSIKNWEHNIGHPSLANIKVMSKLFGVTLEYFVNDNIGSDELCLDVLTNEQKKTIMNLVECYKKL